MAQSTQSSPDGFNSDKDHDENKTSNQNHGVHDQSVAAAEEALEKQIQSDNNNCENDAMSSRGLERWNKPRINTYRYCVVNLSLLIMGMNDACLGVRLYKQFF